MFTLVAAAAALAQQSARPYPQRPEQRRVAPPIVTPVTPPQASVEAEGSDQPIQTIAFEGVEAPAAVAAAAQEFIGRPATRENLIALAGALSRAYERTNVALYTVSIPRQDLADGLVVVELVEG